MTTRKDVLSKIDELMPDITEFIKQKAEKALSCGAIDLDDYNDDYILTKIVLTAVAKELSYAYRPWSEDGRKEVKNLESFL